MAIDDAMADVVGKATEPALAAIKLAWWRERLEELDKGKVPAEPRLRAAAAHLLPQGATGAGLAAIEDGWLALLRREAGWHEQAAERRGEALFAVGATLLGEREESLPTAAGTAFAIADMARRGLAPMGKLAVGPVRVAKALRPLTAMTALALRDMERGGRPFEPEAAPGRAWTLLRHRWTGRLG